MTANTEVYPSKTLSKNVTFSHLFLGRVLTEGRLMLHEVAHDNNFNSSETDHASKPLRIFASKSASDVGIAMPTYFKDLAASLPSRLAAKKVAFTLAEVLITLGIIGIVAALTLPTVIQNYQKQVTVTRLKKAYSYLVQVAQKSIADNGSIDFVEGDLLDEDAVKKFFNTYWLSYFKGVDVFPDKKQPYKLNGNTVFYKHIGGILDSTNVYTTYSGGRIFFNTADGITYFVYIVKWINNKYNDKGELISQDAAYNSEQMVFVDLNGIKPPNTFGKDVFVFYVDFSKGIVRPNRDDCNNTYSGGCAGKIMRDGWQIKSDYPW